MIFAKKIFISDSLASGNREGPSLRVSQVLMTVPPVCLHHQQFENFHKKQWENSQWTSDVMCGVLLIFFSCGPSVNSKAAEMANPTVRMTAVLLLLLLLLLLLVISLLLLAANLVTVVLCFI
jgi:hypothetical protein